VGSDRIHAVEAYAGRMNAVATNAARRHFYSAPCDTILSSSEHTMIEHFLHFLKASHLRDFQPQTILDLGCCTGEQSIELATAFPSATVHAFECSPDALPLAAETFARADLGDRVQLHPRAVDRQSGPREFWLADPAVNRGAGSFYRSTGHEDLQPLNQRPVTVQAVRLDQWAAEHGVEQFDLIWADLQGAELLAFQGMGDLLKSVEAAHVEVTFRELYRGQPLAADVQAYLEQFRLRLWVVIHDISGYFADAIFIRRQTP
jgi:FkbM family methyltransferase